jgi:ATP-dependent Clp protease adaptor protein ClpS
MEQTTTVSDSAVIDDTLYNVIMYNDDVTPFEYVIAVLHTIFEKSIEDGLELSIHIHKNGSAIVATLPMQDAYEKVEAVDQMNERYGFLLQTNVERA